MNAASPKEHDRMPVAFIGHGSPMHAIADNPFTRTLAAMRHRYPPPRAILCVSAHWMTKGTWVTHMTQPKTIHDFGGFPQELFDVQYPAPGSPAIAEVIQSTIVAPHINLDDSNWGLDHGTWAVLRHMYPDAHVPVLQMSLAMDQPPEYHYTLGQKLQSLRDQGILIVGSGNIVHNLRRVRWGDDAQAYDWAIEFDEWSKNRLQEGDYAAFIKGHAASNAAQASVPTLDHYLPLLYTLGAADAHDELRFDYEGIEMGSISMRTLSMTPRSR